MDHRRAPANRTLSYLGPMRQVADDYGNVFLRGVKTPLNVHDWQALSKGTNGGSFLLLKPDSAKTASCADEASPPTAGAMRGNVSA